MCSVAWPDYLNIFQWITFMGHCFAGMWVGAAVGIGGICCGDGVSREEGPAHFFSY
jgi:hypothetical protein